MNLAAEMASYSQALEFKHVSRLIAAGVDRMPHFNALALIGFARVEVDKNDRWQSIEGGKPMIVVAVEEAGAIVDMVAFDPADPNFWALRTGNGWALGADYATDTAGHWGEPLKIYATPLDWLRADGEGCCVIDGFSQDAGARIRAVPSLEVRSNALARALRLHLTKPPALPEIIVRDGGDRRAA